MKAIPPTTERSRLLRALELLLQKLREEPTPDDDASNAAELEAA